MSGRPIDAVEAAMRRRVAIAIVVRIDPGGVQREREPPSRAHRQVGLDPARGGPLGVADGEAREAELLDVLVVPLPDPEQVEAREEPLEASK